MAQQTSAHTRGVPPTRGGNGGHVGEAWGEGWRRYATDNSADPNVADFARLVELNPGNSRRHMGVREAAAVHTCVQGTICTDADELHALT
jgi:hypothetical protein